jgi:hypothetical protein
MKKLERKQQKQHANKMDKGQQIVMHVERESTVHRMCVVSQGVPLFLS